MTVWKHAAANLRQILDLSLRHAEREFLVYEAQRVTFGEHYRSAATLAHRLNELGVRKGDRVAIAAAAGLDFVGSTAHVCFQGGHGVDGLTTVATYAGLHPTIGLYVGVYQLPLRHPVAVARQVAEVYRTALRLR